MSINIIGSNYLVYSSYIGAGNTIHTNNIFDTFDGSWITGIDCNGTHWGYSGSNTTLYLSDTPGINFFGATIINPNQLYRITWTWDGITDNLYIDGNLEVSTTGLTAGGRASITIGRTGGGNATGFNVDGFKSWNTVLSQAEIKNEINSIKPQKWSNIWSWLPCNNGGTDGGDYSGNARNFTVNGALIHTAPSSIAWGDPPMMIPQLPVIPTYYASPLGLLAC